MHYLITGAAGFIGSNLVRALLKREAGIRITGIDNFDPMYSPAIKRLNIGDSENDKRFRLLPYDLVQTPLSDLQSQIPEPVDVIIHLAAKAGVRPSILDPVGYHQSNIIGLQNMLDFARVKNTKQFVFASSSSVYGINDHFPWKEEETLRPISPYGMTKLAGEMMGHVYHHLYGIRFIGLRFFTVYGPGQRPDLAIHKFTRAIVSEQPIPFYGNGQTSRDYTYVDDTVQGIIAAARYEQTGYEIFNLGNSYTVTLQELITALEKTIGKKAVIDLQPDQPGDVPKTFADISKAGQLLNYRPATTLENGLQRFYDWFSRTGSVLLS